MGQESSDIPDEVAIDLIVKALQNVKWSGCDPSRAAWIVSVAMNMLFLKERYVFVVRGIPTLDYEQE